MPLKAAMPWFDRPVGPAPALASPVGTPQTSRGMTSLQPPMLGIRGTLRLLVAVVVLWARLVGPAMAMPLYPADPLADAPICHTGGPEDGQGGHSGGPDHHQHDCLICAACCLAHHVAISTADPVYAGRAEVALRSPVRQWPPAIGPPTAARLAIPPTGPPAPSI